MTVMLSLPPRNFASVTSSRAASSGSANRRSSAAIWSSLSSRKQPVAAQQKAVARHGIQGEEIGRHLRIDPDGPGHDVAAGMELRLLLGQPALRDQLRHQVVIGRDLAQLAVVQHVQAGVPDVDDRQRGRR